jgi:hypothetical protein
MTNEKTYLSYTAQANKLNLEAGLGTDPDLLNILDAITEAHVAGHTLTVADVLALKFASYATLHHKLSFLRDNGFVENHVDLGIDHRTKWVAPTAKTLKHYNALGKALARSAKNSRTKAN